MRNIRPNNRVNKFFDENEFKLEMSFGREWVDGDNNFTISLYRVDKASTESNDIYNEATIGGINLMPEVELSVTIEYGDSEKKAYNQNNSMRYTQDGDFTFHVYEEELLEKGVNIQFGDYIGYDISPTTRRYFEVIDDDILNFGNDKTIMGYKSFYKTIKCKTISPDILNFN